MSSSVTIDWRAVRERERQACLALRAELAQLQAREKQLRLRSAAVIAAHEQLRTEIHHVRRPGGTADSAELSRLVNEARTGLARSGAALDEAIASASRARTAAGAVAWTMRSRPEMAAPGQPVFPVQLEGLSHELDRKPAPPVPQTDTALFAEADAVIEECRLRCPETNLGELTRIRAEMGASLLGDRAAVQELRVRAAQTIKQVKRVNELEERRQRLFVLAEDALAGERAMLRRQVADAPPEDVPRLDVEISAAVRRASMHRAQAEAVAALEQSLCELNYDVQGGFTALLPSSPASPAAGHPRREQPAAAFVVAASPHSAQHGLRVRAGDGQLFVSVVRQAGTGADPQARRLDTEVQQRTCRDLEKVAAAAGARGVQLVLGNAQEPGHPAPELPARCWPSASDSTETSEVSAHQAETAPGPEDDELRRRAWAQEQRRGATQRAHARRSTS